MLLLQESGLNTGIGTSCKYKKALFLGLPFTSHFRTYLLPGGVPAPVCSPRAGDSCFIRHTHDGCYMFLRPLTIYNCWYFLNLLSLQGVKGKRATIVMILSQMLITKNHPRFSQCYNVFPSRKQTAWARFLLGQRKLNYF